MCLLGLGLGHKSRVVRCPRSAVFRNTRDHEYPLHPRVDRSGCCCCIVVMTDSAALHLVSISREDVDAILLALSTSTRTGASVSSSVTSAPLLTSSSSSDLATSSSRRHALLQLVDRMAPSHGSLDLLIRFPPWTPASAKESILNFRLPARRLMMTAHASTSQASTNRRVPADQTDPSKRAPSTPSTSEPPAKRAKTSRVETQDEGGGAHKLSQWDKATLAELADTTVRSCLPRFVSSPPGSSTGQADLGSSDLPRRLLPTPTGAALDQATEWSSLWS